MKIPTIIKTQNKHVTISYIVHSIEVCRNKPLEVKKH